MAIAFEQIAIPRRAMDRVRDTLRSREIKSPLVKNIFRHVRYVAHVHLFAMHRAFRDVYLRTLQLEIDYLDRCIFKKFKINCACKINIST